MTSALSVAKHQLRSSMKAKLARISTESIHLQSHQIAQTVINSPQFQNAQRIGIYLSMPCGEVQTDSIVRDALQSGKQVFVPYLLRTPTPTTELNSTPSVVMEMVRLLSLLDYESLKRDRWGIPSIPDDTAHQREWILQSSSTLDMILVPGVAFEQDSKTHFIRRLGHGKGFYDYFLYRYKANLSLDASYDSANPKPLLYGLALEEQYLSSETKSLVPTGEHDYLLHGLVIGNGNCVHDSA